MKYSTWDEAASHSKKRGAVAFAGFIPDRNGYAVKAELIIRDGKEPFFVYFHTMRKLRKAHAVEVDSLKGWRPL